jgi:hypothetical protein
MKAGLHHISIGFSHVNDNNWPYITSWMRVLRVENYTGAAKVMYGPVPVNIYSASAGNDREQQFFTDEKFSGNQLFAIQYLPLSNGADANVTGVATPNQFIAVVEWAL